jgi:hypothetical protein
MSTLSPREKGCPVPFAMADATADLRKSIAMGYVLAVRGSGIVWGRPGCARGAANCQVPLWPFWRSRIEKEQITRDRPGLSHSVLCTQHSVVKTNWLLQPRLIAIIVSASGRNPK